MREYQPITLLKTKSYSAYQFFATLQYDGQSSEKCMCFALLTIMDWLRKKVGSADCPHELDTPSPKEFEDITLDIFKSYHFNEGCSVDITSLPGLGIWAMQIKEPEVDQDSRHAVIGRFFVTDVGLKLQEAHVEIGVRISVLDPVNVKEEVEFANRPSFLRQLFAARKVKISQVSRLPFNRSIVIKTSNDIAQVNTLIDNPDNLMPIVVFTHAIEEKNVQELVSKLDNLLDLTGSSDSFMSKLLSMENVPHNMAFGNTVLPYDADYVAFQLCGYGRVYTLSDDMLGTFQSALNETISPGDVVIIEPAVFGKAVHIKEFNPRLSAPGRERIRGEIIHDVQAYSKNKRIGYSNIVFELAARRLEIEERIKSRINSVQSGEQQRIDEIYIETDQLLAVYDQEKKNLLAELESLTEEMRAIVSKSAHLEERLKQVNIDGLCIQLPEVKELYQDEIKDLIISVLKYAQGNYHPEGSRAEELLSIILSKNEISGIGKNIFEKLKTILFRNKNLTDSDISELEALGFIVTRHANNHYKLTFKNDPHRSFTLASTASDVRGMKNSYSDIVQQLSVYK